MAKNHDENKDLRSVARVCRVNYSDKTITYDPNAMIGIRRWGKIDYLVHYCGWHLIRLRGAGSGGYIGGNSNNTNSTKTYTRDSKRFAKEHKLTDKTKRGGNNKRAKQ